MNLHKLLAFSITAAAVMLVAQSSANAQINGPVFQGYPGFGCYGGTYGYSSYEIPYYSLHPPVYYSDRIVRRPYGVSPFAVPPGVKPVEYDIPVEPVEPTVINNPHFNNDGKKKASTKVESKKTAAKSGKQASVVIYNPYYQARNEPNGLAHVLK